MRTRIENVNVHITTIKNSLPTSKPAFGRFRVLPEQHVASFIEENGKVISGEGKSVRLLKGKNYSVWYDTERERYKIRIVVEPSERGADMMAACDFEECLNYIKRREHERE